MLSLLNVPITAPAADAVASLPGYGPPPTPQFSGFLNASAAKKGTFLHYWFAATSAQSDWTKAPTIVWFNGGPGSSSILGMLQEQGPLVIDKDGGLMENPYAWTGVANFFVVESPAGVGYSFCEAMKTGGGCANTDKSTAAAAHAALQDFFTTKFPELRANGLFISGESYAGVRHPPTPRHPRATPPTRHPRATHAPPPTRQVYCPTLAAEIVKGNSQPGASPIHLVGMAVGDPCTDNQAQQQSMDMCADHGPLRRMLRRPWPLCGAC
jgi:serine carboxypeptidase-like clade 1